MCALFRIMAAVFGVQSSLPKCYTDVEAKANPVFVRFKKELNYLIAPLKVEKISQKPEFLLKISDALFKVWNCYEGRLPHRSFVHQLIGAGDSLCTAKEYQLAKTHCYGRYLSSVGMLGKASTELKSYLSNVQDSDTLIYALRALIGDVLCTYHILEQNDPVTALASSLDSSMMALECLRVCSEEALKREPCYWLAHNSILLTYSLCLRLVGLGCSGRLIPFLSWAALCMETSVPLMAARHLPLRTSLYIAVCQCYHDVKQPLLAEKFARQALAKVTELVDMERQSSDGMSTASELAFKDAAIRIAVMVFKSSVLECRKKTKSILRPKVRPGVRELLQLPAPRSPTERLLGEMFVGRAAQLLAVLEALRGRGCRRPLEQAPPNPVTELDQDTITDVFQELFCVGTDLCLKALEQEQLKQPGKDLLALALEGSNTIPLSAVVKFVRTVYCYGQEEVFGMLASRAVEAALSSRDPDTVTSGRALELILLVESLQVCLSRTDMSPGVTEGISDKLFQLSHELHQTCRTRPSLLSSDADLLLDATILLWDTARSGFSKLHSPDLSACKHLLSHETGTKYATLLERMVEVFVCVEMWSVDPVMEAEACLKLALLYECQADLDAPASNASPDEKANQFIRYDRKCLQDAGRVLCSCLSSIGKALLTQLQNGPEQHLEVSELEVLHAEVVFTLTRVQVKLASTIPPPAEGQGTGKPSSLKAKVLERERREDQRRQALALLSSADAPVESLAQLTVKCGSSHFHQALLLMLQAVYPQGRGEEGRERALEQAFQHLAAYCSRQEGAWPSEASPAPQAVPPPPQLLYATDTAFAFRPASFLPESGEQVAYYQLFGRLASGSNVKVRLSDKGHCGLGTQVPVVNGSCVLEVRGLQPNQEYVFAVAALTRGGGVVGRGIGHTGPPLPAAHPFPALTGWSYLCQCAYSAGVHGVARQCALKLWSHFTEEQATGHFKYKLAAQPTTPPALLRQFVQSVFIFAQACMLEAGLFSGQLCVGGSLRAGQLGRLGLVQRLMAAQEAAGALNDPGLCLQCVVLAYCCLAPLMQQQVATPQVSLALVRCLAVLSELPERVFQHASPCVAQALHHMAASIAFHSGKTLSPKQRKAFLPLIADNVRGLLLTTMPAVLDKPSVTPASTQPGLLSRLSCSTITSVLPGEASLGNSQQKRRSRRRGTGVGEHVPEESKSPEFKAFEAFVMANLGPSSSDELDLTGQEEPVLLHAVIASFPSSLAYKEVYKFRRRPQFLELFVHLLQTVVARGQVDKTQEWTQEAFAWLTRRNELLLSPAKPSYLKPGGGGGGGGGRGGGGEGGTQKQLATRRKGSVSSKSGSLAVIPAKDLSASGHPGKTAKHMSTAVQKLSSPAQSASGSGGRRSASKPLKVSKALALRLNITNDDLRCKALAVLQSLLPDMWKVSHCRKRLRAVTAEELPWRSQANLLLAVSMVDLFLAQLQGGAGGGAGGVATIPHQWLRFESATAIISGVLPVDEKSLREQAPPSPRRESEGRRQELREMMKLFQRAAVLAQRGGCWVLLQNVCREMWNCLNSLLSALEAVGKQSVAAVYGLACQPLYFAVTGLCDMLRHLDLRLERDSVDCPHVSSLHFAGPGQLDNTNAVGLRFIQQFTYLCLHTFHSQQHWEKLIATALSFDEATGGVWSEDLGPVVRLAQDKLLERLSRHKPPALPEAIDPAAHIDPRGYDVYGGTGLSLGLTSVQLDPAALQWQPTHTTHPTAQALLLECRRLLMRYLAGYSRDWSGVEGLPVEVCPLPPSQLASVISAYDKAVVSLTEEGRPDLLAQASHELGDLWMHSGNTKSAGYYWSSALSGILQCRDPLASWRVKGKEKGGGRLLRVCGVWGCLLGGILAAKMARYVCQGQLDVGMEYTLMSATLFKSVLLASCMNPQGDMEYVSHAFPDTVELVPGLELLSDRFRCPALPLLASLGQVAGELVQRKHAVRSLPMLWLYQHFAQTAHRSTRHTALAKLLKVQCLCQLSLFAEACQLWAELTAGPVHSTASAACGRPLSHGAVSKFSNSASLTDPKNLRALRALMDCCVSPQLVAQYDKEVLSHLSLTQAQLYTSIGSSQGTVPSTSFLVSHSQHPSVQKKHSACHSTVSSTISVSSSCSVKTPAPIAIVLLSQSETILLNLCQCLEEEEGDDPVIKSKGVLQARACLGLADVALALGHSRSAWQLCLAALRRLQGCREGGGDRLVWLQCRVAMATSLVGMEGGGEGGLDCVQQCREGGEECVECGEVEMAALLHLRAAQHCLEHHPPMFHTITKHTQEALACLERLPELSQRGQVLQSQASVLLADVSCVQGGEVGGEMVGVFQGLISMLKEQLVEQSLCGEGECPATNLYKPQLPLLASLHLRLAHAHLLLALGEGAGPAREQRLLLAARSSDESINFSRASLAVQESDQPLLSEAMFYKAWLCSMVDREDEVDRTEESISSLATCLHHISETATDYHLALTCCCELARVLSSSSRQPNPFHTPYNLSSSPSAPSPLTLDKSSKGLAPSRIAKRGSMQTDKVTRMEREWLKSRAQEGYVGWCAVRFAQQCLNAHQNLELLTAELHRESVHMPLTEKALAELPDFALLDITSQGRALLTGDCSASVLAPSAQAPCVSADVSWFSVLSYTFKLLGKCYLPPVPPPLGGRWQLHYHASTARVYPKCRALLSFLCSHFPSFSSTCSIPSPHTIPLHHTPPAQGQLAVATPTSSSSERLGYLGSSDMELAAVLLKPLLPGLRQCRGDRELDLLLALNLRALRAHPPSNLMAASPELLVLPVSLALLEEAKALWREAGTACRAHVEQGRAASRPTSRSSSKQKMKAERVYSIPLHLQAKLSQAVMKLCAAIGVDVTDEDKQPKLEPSQAIAVEQVVHSLSNTTVRANEVYQFFKTLFLANTPT